MHGHLKCSFHVLENMNTFLLQMTGQRMRTQMLITMQKHMHIMLYLVHSECIENTPISVFNFLL